MEVLRARIEELNAAIALCQEKLPASGVPVTRQVSTEIHEKCSIKSLCTQRLQRFEENRQRFAAYIQRRTVQNYKFGIVS